MSTSKVETVNHLVNACSKISQECNPNLGWNRQAGILVSIQHKFQAVSGLTGEKEKFSPLPGGLPLQSQWRYLDLHHLHWQCKSVQPRTDRPAWEWPCLLFPSHSWEYLPPYLSPPWNPSILLPSCPLHTLIPALDRFCRCKLTFPWTCVSTGSQMHVCAPA